MPGKSSYRLAKLGITFPYMVGPMVGLSHVAFRELVGQYLPKDLRPLRFTEMISSRRLPSEHIEQVQSLKVAPGEVGLVPQLLGNEERFIAPSLRKLEVQAPWGFDINMGCPVLHTLKHNWGVRLLGDKKYAAEVVAITKRHTHRPVSVKLRSGSEDNDDLGFLVDFTNAIEDAGADWITVHCRPKGRAHNGAANWNLVAELATKRKIPVVANGDIQTADDAVHIVENLGADGAMIGRAATARPWLLGQIARRLGNTTESEAQIPLTREEESQEYFRCCIRLLNLLEVHYGEGEYSLQKFRFFVIQGSRWFMFGHAFWKAIMRGKSLAETKIIVANYAERNPHPITQRVDFL